MSSETDTRFWLGRRDFLAAAGFAGLAFSGLSGCSPAKPSWFTTRTLDPVATRTLGDTVQYDFGKVWFGNLAFDVEPKNRGRSVRIRLGETLGPDGRINRTPPGTVRYYETEAVLDGDVFRPALTPADLRGLGDYGKPALPFRYAEIDGLAEGAGRVAKMEAVVAGGARFDGGIRFEGAGALAGQLNRLMEFGAHTMEATSFMGLFVDGDRERLPYEADGFINQLGWYTVTSDIEVPRRTIASLLKKPTWPSEWMIHLIFMVWADYRMTGDKAYLKSVIDRLTIFSLTDFIDDTGLVTTFNKPLSDAFVKQTKADYLEDIVDWPQRERDGYDMVRYNTVVNAFVYRGQVLLAELNSALGRTRQAEQNKVAAEKLRTAIETKLIDPATRVYVDGLGSTHQSAHASFFPLAFGLVPAADLPATIAHLKERIAANDGGFPCSVYAAQYLLDGLFEANEGQMALDLMLNRSVRGWLNMLDVHDATITHEAWDPIYKENIDFTHAWGAAFLNVIQRHIVGVHAVQPGWALWTALPMPIPGLSFQARVPTIHGLVQLDANGQSLSIKAPKAVRFEDTEALRTRGWTIASIDYFGS